MVNSLMLRHLLNDDSSLTDYLLSNIVSFEDIKRRLFLNTRDAATYIPDHHYRLLQEKIFTGKKDIENLLRLGIFEIAEHHLELFGTRIHVQQGRQNDWQELITYMPPLILQASYLSVKHPLPDNSAKTINDYYHEFILSNSRYTALPYPKVPQLENYASQHNGFCDLHIHLNGSIETDNAWQDHLSHPEEIYEELKKGFANSKVKEQFEQESHLLEPYKYYKLILIARRIRQVLFDFLFETGDYYKYFTEKQLLAALVDITNTQLQTPISSPFTRLIAHKTHIDTRMSIEMLMFILAFKYISDKPSPVVTSLFHLYLLIYGLCNRLLVQQTHQYGFEQFQKHTLNGLREYSEKTYAKRFFQMHGNEMKNISFLEGRFSPQKNREQNEAMLKAINDGWRILESAIATDSRPELFLVAHFIKKPESNINSTIRFRSLRIDVWERGRVLALFRKNNARHAHRILGVDAAASEFDTPPEVFGPVFRFMRRQGIKSFTYHAGEDFHHILSGLRAIYEAIAFTGLRSGDRIGHATATGIDVTRWLKVMGATMLIRRGDWLDTLVFIRYFIVTENIQELYGLIPSLTDHMYQYFLDIYAVPQAIEDIENAWLLRRFCPVLLFSEDKSQARITDVYDTNEWNDIERSNINKQTRKILQYYHSSEFRKEYNKPISIKTHELFNAVQIELLQLAMLKFMHNREIIIETLPTSNVRIGHHKNFDTYHLWNWVKWEEEGQLIPPIVVGTDDTGIFATTIYNEFANIYCNLVEKTTRTKAMDIIERLNKNSLIYRFQP